MHLKFNSSNKVIMHLCKTAFPNGGHHEKASLYNYDLSSSFLVELLKALMCWINWRRWRRTMRDLSKNASYHPVVSSPSIQGRTIPCVRSMILFEGDMLFLLKLFALLLYILFVKCNHYNYWNLYSCQ
jgi:hypothetical protein